MGRENPEPYWKINWVKSHLLWSKQAIMPAELGTALGNVMTSPANILEDANYNKIVPNQYVVELSPKNYADRFKPLGERLIQQWREKLIERLLTANRRLGRKEYRFGGQLQIELRSASDLKDSHARILCRVKLDIGFEPGKDMLKTGNPNQEVAFLESITEDRRWSLNPGDVTIGRDEACDISLDLPLIQEKRLISAQHARIHIEDGNCFLYDGSLSGKPSVNGTYVNLQRISQQGILLKDGDTIILAAINPLSPRWDSPGVAAFRFRKTKLNPNQP